MRAFDTHCDLGHCLCNISEIEDRHAGYGNVTLFHDDRTVSLVGWKKILQPVLLGYVLVLLESLFADLINIGAESGESGLLSLQLKPHCIGKESFVTILHECSLAQAGYGVELD